MNFWEKKTSPTTPHTLSVNHVKFMYAINERIRTDNFFIAFSAQLICTTFYLTRNKLSLAYYYFYFFCSVNFCCFVEILIKFVVLFVRFFLMISSSEKCNFSLFTDFYLFLFRLKKRAHYSKQQMLAMRYELQNGMNRKITFRALNECTYGLLRCFAE
jgi:hypothetical protein